MKFFGVPDPEHHSAPEPKRDAPDPGGEALLLGATSVDNGLEMERFELLSAYVDGELNPDEGVEVEAWLAEDPQARALFAQLRTIQAGIHHLPTPSLTAPQLESIIDRVFEVVDPPTPLLRPSQLRIRWQGLVAASVTVVTLGSGAVWQLLHPPLMVSIDAAPVKVTLLPTPTQIAERYLLEPTSSGDPFSILLSDEVNN